MKKWRIEFVKYIAIFFVALMMGVVLLPMHTDVEHLQIRIVEPKEEMVYGEEITLECVVNDIEEPYSIQWQYMTDDGTWVDLQCTEPFYKFVLTEDNLRFYYRVVITC